MVVYLKDRMGWEVADILHLLVPFLNDCHSWDWARLKTGIRNFCRLPLWMAQPKLLGLLLLPSKVH